MREANRFAARRRRREAREDAIEDVRSALATTGRELRDRAHDELSDLLDRLRG